MINRTTLSVVFVGLLNLSMNAFVKASDEFPPLATELAEGRQVWLGNCQTCHAYGVAGAPIPMIPNQWSARLQTPRTQLYRHAIEGFYGESDTHMPARGGNPALTDAEVIAAVDYMVALAVHYSTKSED